MATNEQGQDHGPTGAYCGFYRSDDPRMKLLERAGSKPDTEWVAVPVSLIREVLRMRVCRATTVSTHDEDGPLSKPMTLHCVMEAGHWLAHSNGVISWEDC